MYAYLKGTLTAIHPTSVIIDVNGVGYSVFITCRTLGELPAIGQTIQLHTSFIIRENLQALYGFLQAQERDLFELLITVSGIGPKIALSLLGHLTIQEIHTAFNHQDRILICRVPGIGKKMAERMIVELKDRLPNFLLQSENSIHFPSINQIQMRDAVLALINLGYSQTLAQKAVEKSMKELPESTDLAQIITFSLSKI
jgi:holliday junction DNA helicase RuvA